MSVQFWRLVLSLAGGAFVVTGLAGLAQRLPPPGRSLETILLFLLFVLACVLLDKLMMYRLNHQIGASSERQEARRLGQLRIGIPEGLSHLEALRRTKLLENRLKPFGVVVVWREYPSASILLQALNSGEIDFCGGGGTPSVFAQAANLLFVRVARDKYTAPGGEAILVPQHSKLNTLQDLRGSRVAVEEGSTAHYVLIRALNGAGILPADLDIVFLSRQEALPQFMSGAVDAWSVWVPYADSPRRREYQGRSLVSLHDLFGKDPSLQLPTLYYAAPELVRSFPAILKLILEEINEAGATVNRDNLAAVERLRDQLDVTDDWLDGLRQVASERSIVPMGRRALAGLQTQADELYQLDLIPRRVRISDGTYTLIMRQNWTI
jgi:sulfonate transport system substrate-binding protein